MTLHLEDRLSHRRVSDAVRFAEILNSITNVPISGRLLYVTALMAAFSPKPPPTLASLQKTAVERPMEFAQLVVWMRRNGMSPQP